MYDLGILNGTIYVDGNWLAGNLYVKDGKVAAVSDCFAACRQEYDVDGKMLLPGFIDPHVHFSMDAGKYRTADTFYSGSVAAAMGGVTTFIDFLDCAGSVEHLEQLFRQRRALAAGSAIDFSLHASAANPQGTALTMARRAKELGMPTMKLYTTYVEQGCFSSDAFIDSMLEISQEERIRVLVHAENDGLLRKGEIPVREHESSRPALAEISEVVKLAEMTNYRDGWIYIVHVSCGTTVARLRENYQRLLGTNVILESCPHYFLLSSDCYRQPDCYLFTMTPPLRDREEAKRLADEIDEIHTIGSDHCAFDNCDKKHEWTGDIPMGIGGMDHSFALMHHRFGSKIIDKFTKNVAQIHGLYPRKGTLLPGADADIVVYDQNASEQIRSRGNIHSPYAGMVAVGKVQDTLCRGEFVVRNGVFLGGQGQYLNRALDE